ncbi:hypothetical protein KOR34_18270 [Posidoniimonas corsicana]|uniref:Uncharacterized protein n=1 Tax=Posidoniimonas corsicana TaxID=1938618 RepID=A0A5C5VGV3_9BACT|nr:hypothetical protein [Posidoniimonas corsicana]TWT36882.1 hypothetical protein KOR34_18270 [Posidoniimonas corsicana]
MTNTVKKNAALVIVLLLGIACGRGWGQQEVALPPVEADAPVGSSQRYLLDSCGSQFGNAAYIVDSHTGDVFYVKNSGSPRRIGSVAD